MCNSPCEKFSQSSNGLPVQRVHARGSVRACEHEQAAIGRAILVNGTVARQWRRLKNYNDSRQQQQQRGKLSTTGSSKAAASVSVATATTAGKKRENWRTATNGGGDGEKGGRRRRTEATAAGAYVTVVRVNCSSGEEEDKEFRYVTSPFVKKGLV